MLLENLGMKTLEVGWVEWKLNAVNLGEFTAGFTLSFNDRIWEVSFREKILERRNKSLERVEILHIMFWPIFFNINV